MNARRTHARTTAAAFTLVETVISIVIVGVMLAAAMATVGASSRQQLRQNDRAVASGLAQSLMSEIMTMPIDDPTAGATDVFGLETGESGRAAFDDVDDYNGLNDTPPKDKSGTALSGYSGWGRSVAVTLCDPDNPSTDSVTDKGAFRVTVTVKKGTTTILTTSMVRTRVQ